jgi:hypothetical protein
MPTVFMDLPAVAPGGDDLEVIEPEIVGGFDPGAAGRARPGAPAQIGCTLGPGCGCLALPLAVVGAVLASSVLAAAWVLRIGETLGALGQVLARALRGGGGRPGGPPAR